MKSYGYMSIPAVFTFIIFLSMSTGTLGNSTKQSYAPIAQVPIEDPSPCVGLNNYPKEGIETEKALLAGIQEKSLFYDWLQESHGISSGRQLRGDGGMCLEAKGTTLRTASCVLHREYSFAVFIGDSIMREMAWSFNRHASSEDIESECHPWGIEGEFDSKNNPSFFCNKSIADTQPGDALCDPEDRLPLTDERMSRGSSNSTAEDCCAHFWMQYVGCADPDCAQAEMKHWMWKAESVMGTTRDGSKNCSCKGIFVISPSQVHMNIHPNPVLANDYEAVLHTMLGNVTDALDASASDHKLAMLGPTNVNMLVMAMDPIKPDHKAFEPSLLQLHSDVELRTMSSWPRLTTGKLAKNPPLLLPEWDLTTKYHALTCDGIHRETSWDRGIWGCDGYPIVTDVLCQILLADTCDDETIGVCSPRDMMSSYSSM
eukprot:CAMPEP_0167789670 /NCGR_PEP_ID=MMETSP0111_2-20121227/10831_1 /TAXON_ID=91324 /ORGANISM="Lotharella globosa, Strain CCCM811" /LENGTH=428 /DNA_ID=CAMNT_0007681897 /DNA_START=260 /DNA_END=1546 /DNA_ORIENTATION=+